MNTELKIMTVSNVTGLIGKKIRWYAPAYKHNKPYTGVAIITSVDVTKHKPITCAVLEGDELFYAFVDDYDFHEGIKCISYSDSYRNVTFEIIEDNE